MKLKEIVCALGDHFVGNDGRKGHRLLAANGLAMTLRPELQAVEIVDSGTKSPGTYYVPLARILRFYPLETAAPVKKAANQ